MSSQFGSLTTFQNYKETTVEEFVLIYAPLLKVECESCEGYTNLLQKDISGNEGIILCDKCDLPEL